MGKSNNNSLTSKKKVAIIIDKEGWAYYNSARQIKKYLSDFYEIDIIPMDIFGDNIVKMLILGEKYDLMFFFWRGLISWIYSDYSKQYIKDLGFKYEEFIDKYIKAKNILTGVYDHLFINDEIERTKFILDNVKAYTVSSNKLKDIYDKSAKKPAMVITDGVDLDLFKMNDITKYDNIENRKIRIGWTGNSKFKDEKDDDLKGVRNIIMPAIEELKKRGYHIELDIADRNIKMIPFEEMPNYYNNIDIYLCASRTEGTPGTVLEAMACGVPVISTDVGIVSETLGKKQQQYIIKRTKEDLVEKMIELIEHKEKFKELSLENLEQIKKWSWETKAKQYKEFFDNTINGVYG